MGPQNFTNNSSNKKDFLILQVVVKTVSLFILFFSATKALSLVVTNKIQVICKISCIYCKKLNFSAVNTVQYQAQAFS